jgi:excisionase family DNA binding protein
MDQLLYTIAQCCRVAAIGRTKFYELIKKGEIPVRKIGKKTLVAATDLRNWAAHSRKQDPEEPGTAGLSDDARSASGGARARRQHLGT